MTWGAADAPKLTLVGKGIVFDTGGLNLKPEKAMLLMKKDMGGAAQALGLASMIMDAGLPLRLRVLIGAAENAVGGAAFRPGDVLRSRKGLTVEIGNTDAEGRLVLADVLTLADAEMPDLMIDFATLTGAARVALGPDLPAMFTKDDALAEEIRVAGEDVHDPVWRLPLWPRYDKWLKSPIADLNHVTAQPFAGSITAALFLQRFVENARQYAHFDVFAWNPEDRPGRPKGGEAQTIRALYHWLGVRYRR
jgi:leucyl aminopeptidase